MVASRERLCGLLWSDRGEEQARASLRQTLAVLRKELGVLADTVLVARDDMLGLEGVAVDALDVLQAKSGSGLATLRAAAELCRGPLLADTAIRDPGFDEWRATKRRRLEEATIQLLEKLSLLESGEAAVAAAKQLLALNPLREASHRTLMAAPASAGEMALALQQFEVCMKILLVDFGVEPAPETTALQ